jgi:AraC-like DNA-binding protein
METRLKVAEREIGVGDEQTSVIAYHLGFKSVSHFVRQFKLRWGMSPLQYRRAKRLTAAGGNLKPPQATQ